MTEKTPIDSSKYVQEYDDRLVPATAEQIRAAQLTIVEYADRQGLPREETRDLLRMLTGEIRETTIRPRPGDLEAACERHAPVPSGERVTSLGPERCDLCGLSWGSPMHESPYIEQVAAHLNDLAADYAGPYTDPEETK
jgi:hypothetical protein